MQQCRPGGWREPVYPDSALGVEDRTARPPADADVEVDPWGGVERQGLRAQAQGVGPRVAGAVPADVHVRGPGHEFRAVGPAGGAAPAERAPGYLSFLVAV